MTELRGIEEGQLWRAGEHELLIDRLQRGQIDGLEARVVGDAQPAANGAEGRQRDRGQGDVAVDVDAPRALELSQEEALEQAIATDADRALDGAQLAKGDLGSTDGRPDQEVARDRLYAEGGGIERSARADPYAGERRT